MPTDPVIILPTSRLIVLPTSRLDQGLLATSPTTRDNTPTLHQHHATTLILRIKALRAMEAVGRPAALLALSSQLQLKRQNLDHAAPIAHTPEALGDPRVHSVRHGVMIR